MYIFFDTETTGLPKNWNVSYKEVDNWPRLVQLAWLEYANDGKQVAEQDYIIKPDGFRVPKEATRIHRISHEKAMEEGIPLREALTVFSAAIDRSQYIVAHNISFDESIIAAEFLRENIGHAFFNKERICTMKTTADICKILSKKGYKWPTLSELYQALFHKTFEESHDARFDTRACAACFWELKKMGRFETPVQQEFFI